MWGISPASDLLKDLILLEEEGSNCTDPINILLLCPSDPRSVIKTLAKARIRGSEKKSPALNFFIFEETHEALARHFLLLSILLDQTIPMRQRAVIFLEVFGNLMIQDKTASNIEDKGKCLVELILDGDDKLGLEGHFNLSFLKQRDLDELGSIFEFWTTSAKQNLKDTRDGILRSFYGSRYDSRGGVSDWDYHTHIKPYASIIHPIQFREWRLHGQAFEFGGASYTSENITLMRSKGCNNSKQSAKIDVATGPFLSYGIDCDRTNSFTDGLFDVANKGTGAEQHRHSATEVSVYNILSFMWEIENGENYHMKVKGDIHSGLGNYSVSETEVDSTHSLMSSGPANSNRSRMQYSFIPVSDFSKISKKKFGNFFDSVFISDSTTSILENSDFYKLLKDGAVLTVETCRFDVSKETEYKEDSIEKIRNIMAQTSAVEVEDLNKTNALLKFRFKAK